MKDQIRGVLAVTYQTIVVGKQKALVAFLVAAVATFLAKHGLTLNSNLKDLLSALLVGLIAHGSVYFTSNK